MKASTLPPQARGEVGEAWCALEAELGHASVMCSWDWTDTWLEHYGDVVRHRFVRAERDGAVRGIALIADQAGLGRLRPPTIALGTAGEPRGTSVFVERNRLLASDRDRAEFASALMAELTTHHHRWQRLRLDGMVTEDAEALAAVGNAMSWQVEESPVADLAGFEEEAPSSLPERRRRRLQRTLSLLGEVRCEWADDGAQARSILDELIVLHQAHWEAEGERGAFASDRFRSFHCDLVARLLPLRRAALFRVRQEDETLACLYGLIEGGRLLFYQGGVVRRSDNKVRVGLAAHALFMRACHEHGLAEYDFLAPAARYKRELSNRSERLVWAELERPGLRLLLERTARRARRAWRARAA